jgi:hypothetical protein
MIAAPLQKTAPGNRLTRGGNELPLQHMDAGLGKIRQTAGMVKVQVCEDYMSDVLQLEPQLPDLKCGGFLHF